MKRKKKNKTKGIVIFKDGHTEDIIDQSVTFIFKGNSGVVINFTTDSGKYAYSELYDFKPEIVFDDTLFHATRPIYQFYKVSDTLIPIDSIETLKLNQTLKR